MLTWLTRSTTCSTSIGADHAFRAMPAKPSRNCSTRGWSSPASRAKDSSASCRSSGDQGPHTEGPVEDDPPFLQGDLIAAVHDPLLHLDETDAGVCEQRRLHARRQRSGELSAVASGLETLVEFNLAGHELRRRPESNKAMGERGPHDRQRLTSFI